MLCLPTHHIWVMEIVNLKKKCIFARIKWPTDKSFCHPFPSWVECRLGWTGQSKTKHFARNWMKCPVLQGKVTFGIPQLLKGWRWWWRGQFMKKDVRNHMSRSVYESNVFQSFTLMGGSEVHSLFKKIFLPRIEWNIQICTENPSPQSPSSWVRCWGPLQKMFFACKLHEMSQTTHKIHVWQHHLHGARGVKSQFMKNFTDGNSMNVKTYTKLMISIPPPPQGVWAQFTKIFIGNWMKEIHRILMFVNLHPMGKGGGLLSLKTNLRFYEQ